MRVEDSLISGAEQNALDFVGVRSVRLRRNVFENAEDWCVYTKGGSSDVVVTDNVFRGCGTGGYLAGQGSGLQYMVAPFFHYEAVGVTVARNTFRDIVGAAFGVNGAYNALFVDNVAYRTGARSHLVEASAGGRTCDPGEDAVRCQPLVDAGAWGTAEQGDGIEIPNRHVYLVRNVFAKPAVGADPVAAGSRPKSAEPHSPQKTLSRPPSGDHARRCSSPAVSAHEPGASLAEAWTAVPVRCWQRVQWQ